jgi:hypothetical protein
MAKAPSPRVLPHVLERLWSRNGDGVALASASMPSLGTEIHGSVDPWLDGGAPLPSPLPHSAWGYCSNVQNQQIATPVYGQQELNHQPFLTSFPSGLDSMALVQHGSHVYSTGPEQPVAGQDREPRVPAFEQCAPLAPALESSLPPFSSLRVAQEQFTFQLLDHVPLFQFSDDPPHHSPTAPPARPETSDAPRSTGGYTTTAVSVPYSISQDESSYSSSQPVPFDAPPEAVWPTNYYHQSPTSSSPLLQQPHFERPFSNLDVTGTFTFDVSQVIPYFDFSPHVPPPPPPPPVPPPHPDGIAIPLPRGPQVMSDARPPIPANRECPSRQMSFDQGVQSQQTPSDPGSQPQEVVVNPLPSQPPTPTGQADSATDAEPSPTGAKMTVDGDDNDNDNDDDDGDNESSSDSNSDSDMDSDSDSSNDDSDSDSDSDDSSEDESDAMATSTIVCKTSSSRRASDASSIAQDVVLRVPADKDSSSPTTATTKDDETDSDSDSDGYFEHVSTPATTGVSNDGDESSSDEDMSDHEEEYRLYWEMFYTPRHRRPPQVSVVSV